MANASFCERNRPIARAFNDENELNAPDTGGLRNWQMPGTLSRSRLTFAYANRSTE